MYDSPGRLIGLLYRKGQIFWTRALKEQKIGAAEYPVLLRLYRGDGLTQEEITRDLSVDKSAVTRVIQTLLDKGLVERRKDEKDRRCNRIFLTSLANAQRENIKQIQLQWNQILQQQMSEEEQKLFFLLLEKTAESIKEETL